MNEELEHALRNDQDEPISKGSDVDFDSLFDDEEI